MTKKYNRHDTKHAQHNIKYNITKTAWLVTVAPFNRKLLYSCRPQHKEVWWSDIGPYQTTYTTTILYTTIYYYYIRPLVGLIHPQSDHTYVKACRVGLWMPVESRYPLKVLSVLQNFPAALIAICLCCLSLTAILRVPRILYLYLYMDVCHNPLFTSLNQDFEGNLAKFWA